MNPETVDALLFDLGGVVLEVDFEKVFAHLCESNDVSIEHIKQQFSMDHAYKQHERGLMAGTEYLAHLRKTLNLTADDASLTASWNAIFGNEINAALDAIDKIRGRFACYAFTNTNAIHQEYWDREHPRIRQSFDHMFVSSEIGLRKPDAIAFEHILKETTVKAGAMLFFDDTHENIEGAARAGLQTVYVKSSIDVVQALDALP